jgi:hypothetical protein
VWRRVADDRGRHTIVAARALSVKKVPGCAARVRARLLVRRRLMAWTTDDRDTGVR